MTGDDTVRLTYAELAQARRVSLDSAKRLTLRRRWPKQIGNDGLARIIVPASALPPGALPDDGGDARGGTGDDVGDDASLPVGPAINGHPSNPAPLSSGHDAPTDD